MLIGRLHSVKYDNKILEISRKCTRAIMLPLQAFLPVIFRIDMASLAVIYCLALASQFYSGIPINSLSLALNGLLTIKYLIGYLQIAFILFLLIPSRSSNFVFKFCADIVNPYIVFILRYSNVKKTESRLMLYTLIPVGFVFSFAILETMIVTKIYTIQLMLYG